MLICLSGVDCSGKSTQVERLTQTLRARGVNVSTMWYRPGYSTRLDRLRSVVRKTAPSTLPAAGTAARDRAFSRGWVRSVWILTAALDMFVQYAVQLRLRLWRGETIICDRYVDDALVDFALRFPGHHLSRAFVSLAASLSPRPAVSFVLMLPWDQVCDRAAAKQEPFADDDATRRRRYDAYVALAFVSGAAVDASRSVEAVHQSILARVPAVAPFAHAN